MAEKKSQPKACPAPKQPKPRQRFVKELLLVEPLVTARGQKAWFKREKGCEIISDLDARLLSVKITNDKTWCLPFEKAKYWHPDVGVVTE